MTKEEIHSEYDSLITICGTGMLQRVVFLSREIDRVQKEEAANSLKEEPKENK